MGAWKLIFKWTALCILINAMIVAVFMLSYRTIEEVTVDSVLDNLNTILESRLESLSLIYVIPRNRDNAYDLNVIMSRREASIGYSGESYVVELLANDNCRMATLSRFEGFNDVSIYPCTNHWSAVFASGEPTRGAWMDYRGIPVYGAGQRIQRLTGGISTTYAVVVERDVQEVAENISNLLRLFQFLILGFLVGSTLFCIVGYIAQRRERKLSSQSRRIAIENKATLDNASSGMCRSNLDGCFTMVNQGMYDLFGYDEGDMLGNPITMIIPDHLMEGHVQGWSRMLAGEPAKILGKKSRTSIEAKRKDGSIFPASLTVDRVNLPDGDEIIGVFVDLTEEYEDKARIQRKSEQLTMMGKTARHDSQNHNTVAQTCLQYMLEVNEWDRETAQLALDEIEANIDLGNSMSEYSRIIESDNGKLSVEEYSVVDLFESVRVQGLDLEYSGDLGVISCNKGLMGSVFRNLQENCQKYSESNPRMVVKREGQQLICKDWAGGFGVKDGVYYPDHAERLTQPNQRGHTDVPGSGLGLSSCIASVGAHGYKFMWNTDAEKGTTEWIIKF